MISWFTLVMKSKLYGPNAQVTQSSGLAQWRRFWPSAVTAYNQDVHHTFPAGSMWVGSKND
jgi:hypothetical protein